MSNPSDPAVVRIVERRIREAHADVLERVDACADRVAARWDGPHADDRSAVVLPLRRELEATGFPERSVTLLEDAVTASGYELTASPVPAPPYVVVTSRGPVLRATIEPGRLVILLEAFAVDRAPEPGYRRLNGVRPIASLE